MRPDEIPIEEDKAINDYMNEVAEKHIKMISDEVNRRIEYNFKSIENHAITKFAERLISDLKASKFEEVVTQYAYDHNMRTDLLIEKIEKLKNEMVGEQNLNETSLL